MFSRVNHREVVHKPRISEKHFELTHQSINSTNPALFQPQQTDYIEGSGDNLSIAKKQLIPDCGTCKRLLTIQKASDVVTSKLKVYEIAQRTLQLCQEVIPFERGNIVLNRDGKWKAVHKKTKHEFETILKALDNHGFVERGFTKQASTIISVRELGLKESLIESGKILSFPMALHSKRMGVCLIYISIEDSNFSLTDIEAIKIIVKQATLALHYQQIQEELVRKENIISGLKKWFIRSTQMAIVGEIAKGLTHEINNPLQIILGKIQMAAIGTGSQEVLKHIESQSLHIASLLRSFSDISKDRKGDRTKVIELSSFIKNTLEVIRKQVERKGIKIHYCFQNESITIHGDSGCLRSLILNSVLEAKKRMPSGGELFISTSIQDNGIIQIEFRDTAPTIERVLDSNVTSYDFETADYAEIANVLLAAEMGAKIDYKNDENLSGNRIVFCMAPNT